jgi:peptidoglycan/LPS O-acetylase OafA/YrhL
LLFQEHNRLGSIDLKRFLARRLLKIWPSYYAFLLTIAVTIVCFGGAHAAMLLRQMWPLCLHVQNYFMPGLNSGTSFQTSGRSPFDCGIFIAHLWSLGVEEHFYLAMPLLVVYLYRRSKIDLLPAITVVITIGCLLLRTYICLTGQVSAQRNIMPTHLRVDSLMVGVCLAYYYHTKPSVFASLKSNTARLWLVSILLLTPMFRFGPGKLMYSVGFTTLALGYATIICIVLPAHALWDQVPRAANSRLSAALAYIGKYSYSIYLYHLTLGKLLANWFMRSQCCSNHPELRWLCLNFLFFGWSFVVGIGAGRLIEYPAIYLRDRCLPQR